MRLAALSLRAFGPFRDVTLDLAEKDAIHVVYGPNEAGKSTALRAITGLFYGIPHISSDAHTHRAEDLRIGGRVESSSGAALTFVRRKGRVRTLLDEAGAPLPETALIPFLGGVGEDVFRAAFGLDHETLRIGAQALLEGRGHLGESLFGAGLGGTGVVSVLEALRREADELYSPLARTKRLNAAIRALVEARKRAQTAAMPASVWLTQEQSIREAHEERTRIDEEGARLRSEERRLSRARQLVRLFAQLRAVKSARAEIGDVRLLPDDATSARTLAESELADATAQIRRAEEARERLVEQRDALAIPHALVSQADAVDDVATRLGSHRKAAVDLPRVRAELRTAEEEATEILRALGLSVDAAGQGIARLRAEVEPLRVDVSRDERIRSLARDAAVLSDRARLAEQELGHARSEAAVLRAKIASIAGASEGGAGHVSIAGPNEIGLKNTSIADPSASQPRVDLPRLRRAAARARSLGNVTALVAKTGRTVVELTAKAEAERASLALSHLRFEAIARLPVPLHETVDRHASEERALLADERALADRLTEARATLDRARIALAEVAGDDLPTDADLRAARADRDEAVRSLLSFSEDGTRPIDASRGEPSRRIEAIDAARVDLSRRNEAADRIADGLRAEAGRVAERARLAREVDVRAETVRAIERDVAAFASRRIDLASRWSAAWSSAGITPRSPDEMRGFLRRHEHLTATAAQLAAAESERAELLSRVRDHLRDLDASLRPDASSPKPASAPQDENRALQDMEVATQDKSDASPERLAELLDAAERALSLAEEAQREERALAAAEATILEAERKRARHAEESAAWDRAWIEATRGLPARPGASPPEVLRVLDTLARLFAKLDEARRTLRRVEGMERDAREFTARAEALAREHAPELLGRPPDAVAVEIGRRFHQAHADLEKLDVLAKEILAANEALAEQRARAERASSRLDALLVAAGVATLEALARAERASADAKRLERQIELLEGQIRDVTDGADEAELLREAEAFGGDGLALTARIDELEERIADNARERSQIDRTIGARTEGLEKLREGDRAADAALDLGAAAAEVRALATTYARARAASLVLEREIEAYKREHQGPIVARAAELFRALTLGSFSGLATGWGSGDEATLRCVREGGREVDVEGLSDGTRDQLYLALRLATIERFAAHAEPMPLVLDDAFVHFDDARARAALLALSDLLPRAQVLFFTHHERLVAIAEDALGPRCAVHRLAPSVGKTQPTPLTLA
ncbi:MAG: AAA family ATPase [Polyangiaceae bacterium]